VFRGQMLWQIVNGYIKVKIQNEIKKLCFIKLKFLYHFSNNYCLGNIGLNILSQFMNWEFGFFKNQTYDLNLLIIIIYSEFMSVTSL
jgi:predicted ATPase